MWEIIMEFTTLSEAECEDVRREFEDGHLTAHELRTMLGKDAEEAFLELRAEDSESLFDDPETF